MFLILADIGELCKIAGSLLSKTQKRTQSSSFGKNTLARASRTHHRSQKLSIPL
jgi:hypothetical protein